MDTPKLLTAVEAGRILRKNPWWVTAECRAGRLRAAKYGDTWHIPEDAIDEYVTEKLNKPPPVPVPRRRKQRAS